MERKFVVQLYDGFLLGGENSRTEFPSEALRFTRQEAQGIALRFVGAVVAEVRSTGSYNEEDLLSDADFVKTVAW